MSRSLRFLAAFSFLSAALGCGMSSSGDVTSAADGPAPPGGPIGEAPTGTKWQGVEIDGACGGTTLVWVQVDEVCAGTDDAHYLDAFRAPIFRDGAIVASTLFTADATHLWALDPEDPTAVSRLGMTTGVGHPLALAEHGGRLLVAAGAEGMLALDVTDPAAPIRVAEVALPGPALDVFVDGDTVWIAMGSSGIAEIDVSSDPPALVRTLDVPGFAAAVKTAKGLAFVAACETFAVIDLASGALLATTWLSDAVQSEILVAPAKDVEIVGDVAFVAAGRFGAVAVDVKDPAAPFVLGNCTVEHDLAFYASGVRASGGRLFIAGGEWGILVLE
jgi:hypothetical protein